MPDQPTRVEATVALTALLQALVAAARPGSPADRGIYAQNRWAALRFGGKAELIHPAGDRLVPAAELLRELADLLRPTTETLGTTELLAPLATLAQADDQLELGRREGLRALCERLIALT
jgi:gamma-glutamyl:cysteine ligase YbdK (ATP-grasp superfamily)